MMASMVANGNRDGQSLVLNGVDPETCMIVFKNHWAQVVKILEKHDPLRGSAPLGVMAMGGGFGGGGGLRFGPIPGDEASAVQNYVEHILFLLMEEEAGLGGAMGPILEFVVMENVMERLFLWSLRRQFTDDMKLEQLKMYEMLIGQARQPLLHHKPVLRPLMMLLSSCSGTTAPSVEAELVLLLHQLCCVLAKDPSVLELFFHTSEDQGAANFLIFSLLIPFIHREGSVGQQARDALLLIMALSAENQRVAQHIAQNTYFCPVLATGLSGLYSSLPPRLELCGEEEWHCLARADWLLLPALVQFLNSLEFCNAVIQVADPSIRNQLVSYIYNGFLVPVLAPALHKLTVEEVTATTAYLDLFLRSVSEPALLHTFLSFILLHRHDNVHILDTLVSRINTPFQLGTVSLALFRTLIGLYCEDVMLQLILRYLIPCNHMMLSQRRVVRERDCYSVWASRILALTPSCCPPGHSPPPLRQLDSILWSKTPDCPASSTMETEEEEDDGGYSCVIGSELHLDVSYLHYLTDARLGVASCLQACTAWSAPYDGQNPPPEEYQPSSLEEAGSRGRHAYAAPRRPRPRPVPPAANPQPPATSNQLELEWDDSYDACPVASHDATESASPPPPVAEPPKHIQEMRRNATLLVQGAYIEESDFLDDVMVYNLVAKKDLEETGAETKHSQSDPEVSLRNGLGSAPRSTSMDDDEVCSDAGVGGQPDENANEQSAATEAGDDLVAQYEELIRTLDGEAAVGSTVKAEPVFRNPGTPVEEEEVDFSSFSADTPEAENAPSPFGAAPRGGTRSGSAPFTGPFVSVLLSRLENMLDNSVHVNLLLTGILAQLASYPQPLLQSFLLNTNMVFQPSVRSLYQVLASLKNQIEQQTVARKDFPELITAAQRHLLAREASLQTQGTPSGEHRELGTNEEGGKMSISLARTDVFATVLFTEFLKELAAIAQEHSILSHVPMEE